MGVNAGDFNPGRQAQDFGNAGRAGVADVRLRDDVDRGGSAVDLYRFFGDSGDLGIPELLQAQTREPRFALRVRFGALRETGIDKGYGQQQTKAHSCKHEGTHTSPPESKAL